MDNPKFDQCWCDGYCPFLEHRGKDQYDLNYYCKKYNVDLDYYDWVLQTIECYKENVDSNYEV